MKLIPIERRAQADGEEAEKNEEDVSLRVGWW
jgi:hypothetical protein